MGNFSNGFVGVIINDVSIYNALVAFSAQFALVFLLGFQTANIRDRAYHLVFVVSILLSVAQLGVLTSVVNTMVIETGAWFVYVAFVLGGACGVMCSLWFADWLNQRRKNIQKTRKEKY